MKKPCLWKSEQGAMTIVEATFVFPIVFFVVLFMIMAGEAYYQQARVEFAVTQAAVDGAARCENPMLGKVIADGSVPTSPTAVEVLPYRYIFTSEAKTIASEVSGELEEKVSSFRPFFFWNMYPHNVSVRIDLKMNPFISAFPVQCSFEIPFPIKMIFSNNRVSLKYQVSVNASIGDPSELIRNISVVTDSLEMSETASGFGSKVKSGLEAIGGWVN